VRFGAVALGRLVDVWQARLIMKEMDMALKAEVDAELADIKKKRAVLLKQLTEAQSDVEAECCMDLSVGC
jgi:hypothetical protein